jgi:flagellar biosynthesis/type III secretory pathway protein FliH
MEHTDAMLKLMSVLTGSRRFEEMIPKLSEEGGTTMCEVIDRLINEGIEEGHKKGLQEGVLKGLAQGKIETLAVLVKDGTLSLSRAAQIANLSEAEFISSMNHLV